MAVKKRMMLDVTAVSVASLQRFENGMSKKVSLIVNTLSMSELNNSDNVLKEGNYIHPMTEEQ